MLALAWFGETGVNYYSTIYQGSGETRIKRGDLYLVNAVVGYKFDDNFVTQFNVNNIFDKKYYEGIGSNSMNYGAPRSATVSLNYQF